MDYKIVELKEKKVTGISRKTTNENMQAVSDIGQVWGEFIGMGVCESIPNKADTSTIGLYADYEGDFTKPYMFLAGCEVTKFTGDSKLTEKTILAGKYAMFSVRGHIQQAVGAAWNEIWSMNLDRAYTTDCELYHNNSQDMNDQFIDIYISLK